MTHSPADNLPHDYTVYVQGKPVAFLEVKRRYGTDENWARAWHQLLLERTGNPVHAAVWLITPDRLYAWKADAEKSEEPKVLEAEPLLKPYFERLKIASAKVDPQVFEGIVGLWLRDIAREQPGTREVESELLDTLRGGEVVSEIGV